MTRPQPNLIPNDWTPEQALAVYDFFEDITTMIWDRYEIQLIDLLAPQQLDNDRDNDYSPYYRRTTTTDNFDD